MVRKAHHPERSRRVNHNAQNLNFQTLFGDVWVIEYWSLKFFCYLDIENWCFKKRYLGVCIPSLS
jgi:hypothetical protein